MKSMRSNSNRHDQQAGSGVNTQMWRRGNEKRRQRSGRLLGLERLEERALMTVVSHWTADNTAMDAVGTNHGSLVSGTTYATGQVGQAFSFDGVNDRVQIADSPSLALTQSMTIEGWLRVDEFPSGTVAGTVLFRGDNRGGLDPYHLALTSGGTLSFQIGSLTASTQIQAPIGTGQFVHIAATLDDATGVMRLYENGVLMAQTTTAVRPFADLDPASNPEVVIGYCLKGLTDDLRLYDEALSAEQIQADFEAQKGTLPPPSFSISDAVVVEDDVTVKFGGNLVNQGEGGLQTPYQMVFGPDGHVYVSTLSGNSVLRYDAMNGHPLPAPGKSGAEFVSPGAGGLDVVRSIAFGPDGKLYAVGQNSDAVFRFDAVTGEPAGISGQPGDAVFIAPGSGGLDQPRGLLFHSDGYLYVTSVGSTTPAPGVDSILRFDAITGAPAGISGQSGDAVFVPSGSGGLDNPSEIVFHAGAFYVASTSPSTSNSVLKYSTAGDFLGAFVPTGSGGLAGPADIIFHDGFLYVASWSNNKVLRYNGTTGAFVDEVVSGGGLASPLGLLFASDGDLLVTSRDTGEIRRYTPSPNAVFTVTLNAPSPTTISADYSAANGTATGGSDFASATGTLAFFPGQLSKTIVVHTLGDTVGEPRETFYVNLSNPVGATILDGSATGTIKDDDATKFYVVDDGSVNLTYEYADGNNSIESYTLNSGNTAPRGAASNAAGDKVWSVDANRKVYVYNTSGGLLGSWTAGTLASNATVEGITTNGTDVWIVDARSDKVYKYTGAASRISGSQNAASSFTLNINNRSPKDIVTDGTYLYVVNDSTTDKVFKYTLSGSLVGSWTMSGGGGSPTGITLDPSNVSHLWVVDSATDRVYQYDGAASRTSGSQTPSTSFALAAGNTNPQGIADPPPATALLSDASVVAAESEGTDVFATWNGPAATPPSSRWDARTRESTSHRTLTSSSRVDAVMSRWDSGSEPGLPAARGSRPEGAVVRRAVRAVDLDLLGSEWDESLDAMADALAARR